jgi:hypothetical protein
VEKGEGDTLLPVISGLAKEDETAQRYSIYQLKSRNPDFYGLPGGTCGFILCTYY